MNKKPASDNFLKNTNLKNVKTPPAGNGKSFVKITDSGTKTLSPTDRVALNRKGNEFFNNGNIDAARRIFITTGYSDGLTRVGDHYCKNNDYIEALKMYCLAPAPDKKDNLIKKMSGVVLTWLAADTQSPPSQSSGQ
ncbi:MAG: hypothetical protein FWC36_00725 [Spirochaetes bacterium]|nr:hypothetical protein [Spirochaetota bacterium]